MPNYGRRLIPLVIDERAQANHSSPYASIPSSTGAYRDVSYLSLSNAINRSAGWLVNEFGVSSSFATLAYIGPNDLRYQIFMVAAVKTGHVLFLPSPRNSTEAFEALLAQSQPVAFLAAKGSFNVPDKILNSLKLQKVEVPDLNDLLDPAPVEHIPFLKSWEQARSDPFVRIHTSGSTGLPKLVTLRHGSFSAIDGFQLLANDDLASRFGQQKRVFCAFPPFHVAGITYSLAGPCWVDCSIVLPPQGPLTADVVNNAHLSGRVEHTLLPPSILVDLMKNKEYAQNVGKLDGVLFAGGPLPRDTGKRISEHSRLMSSVGTTEANMFPQLHKDPEDWEWFKFNTAHGGLQFRPCDEDLYEMVVVRHPELDLMQPVFVTFPSLYEFATKDLYEKHPSKPGLWKYRSRLDDLIVLSNGEKIDPVAMENTITTNPFVKGCLIFGQGKFQAAALIELEPEGFRADKAKVIEDIWKFCQRANETALKHGRIAKEFLFFADSERPFARAGKGTIQRAATLKLYAQDLEAFYENVERNQFLHANERAAINLTNMQQTIVTLHLFLINELQVQSVTNDGDFFDIGLDSLQVINLVRAINRVRPQNPIDIKQVYDHPSINKLAKSLHAKRNKRSLASPYDSDDEEVQADWILMSQIFSEMTKTWGPSANLRRERHRVLLRSSNEGPVIPPDSGSLAWLQVLASFLLNINNWGLINTFGVFQAYYQTSLLSSYSPFTISWVGTVQGALILLVGVFSGPLFDAGYFKVTALLAGIGIVIALVLLSFCQLYYQIFLAQGILLGCCSGFLFIPSIALIPIYFKNNRGLALGLATGGGSIGGVFYPIVFRRLVPAVGFPWTVRVMALISLVTTGISVVLMKPVGPRTRRQFINAQAFKEPAYVFFMLSSFFTFAALFIPYVLSVVFATNALHINGDLAFYLLPVLSGAQFGGRIFAGAYADFHHKIFGPEIQLCLAELVAGILGFSWLGVHNLGGYIVWTVLYGIASGVAMVLPPIVLPHICPNLAVFGTRLGILYACAGAGVLISVPVATAADQASGGFRGSAFWVGACCIFGGLWFSMTAKKARTRRILYEAGKRPRRIGIQRKKAEGH